MPELKELLLDVAKATGENFYITVKEIGFTFGLTDGDLVASTDAELEANIIKYVRLKQPEAWFLAKYPVMVGEYKLPLSWYRGDNGEYEIRDKGGTLICTAESETGAGLIIDAFNKVYNA